MATKIRLARFGTKKKPFYRVVVTDSDKPRETRFIEQVGTYDPHQVKLEDKFKLKMDRVQHWIGQGAQPTVTVKSFLKKLS